MILGFVLYLIKRKISAKEKTITQNDEMSFESTETQDSNLENHHGFSAPSRNQGRRRDNLQNSEQSPPQVYQDAESQETMELV